MDRPAMKDLVRRVLDEHRDNPYLEALGSRAFERDDFVETQIQFFFAVVFFSRPMAAVAAKIPTAERRMEVIRNVWEEHGEGNFSLAHGNTFLVLLDRFGVSEDDVEARALWPEVRAFNTILSGAAVLDSHLVSVGVMGIIERMFVDISAAIGRGIVDNGWLPRERMVHYKLHEKLDVKHSDDFFAVLEPSWNENATSRYYVEQGIRLGAYSFDRLYRDLWHARKRRAMRDVRGPHTPM
jgi:pyrroloquinoline-quinone synthase